MKVTHLYVGDLRTNLVTAFCGWRDVALRHTTWDWRRVTCNGCLGRRAGLTRIALEEAAAAKAAQEAGMHCAKCGQAIERVQLSVYAPPFQQVLVACSDNCADSLRAELGSDDAA